MTDKVNRPAIAVPVQGEVRQHTPGSWKAHFEEAYFVTGPDLGRVAMMMNLKGAHGLGGRRSGAESAANCRLIAAAPDLLAALQALRLAREQDKYPSWERGVPEFNKAEAMADDAIAKALGSAA